MSMSIGTNYYVSCPGCGYGLKLTKAQAMEMIQVPEVSAENIA